MTDSELQQAVLHELQVDPEVDETAIGVTVDAGVVVLTGSVGSWAQPVAAQRAALRAVGVMDIANNVVVHVAAAARRTDTQVARAVRSALEHDEHVPAASIRSVVTDGWVTLTGEVATWDQREASERAVRELPTVHGVSNAIQVAP